MVDRKIIESSVRAMQCCDKKLTAKTAIDFLLVRFLKARKVDIARLPFDFAKPSSALEKVIDETVPEDATLFDLMSYYELLLPQKLRSEKGITFTPEYIATHIVRSVIDRQREMAASLRILDPSCGIGVFMLAALICLREITGKSSWEIVRDNLYGLDIVPDNVEVTKKVLFAECIVHDGKCAKFSFDNVRCVDSLKTDWRTEFGCEFDGVVGNPPYINPHDLPAGVGEFLRRNFQTTTTGTTNIYYAFIEHGIRFVSPTGALSYIIPNNFITITAAAGLRRFLVENSYVSEVIDFADNMIFAPVRTYNAIITLDRRPKNSIGFVRIGSAAKGELPKALASAKRCRVAYTYLNDDHRWTLLSPREQGNIRTIETRGVPIRNFIRTGIATLRDGVYLVDDFDGQRYLKTVGDRVFSIEPEIVRTIFKVSTIDATAPVENSAKHIIFPYERNAQGKMELIDEARFKRDYPGAYGCLLAQKAELDKRDKGKPNPVAWYAYGRTQGINFYGEKLLYPTFTNSPKFMLIPDKSALFCNGYAVFASDEYPLDVLKKILNSSLMKYYIDKTSYPIEGGFMCYQKKFIERFSVPPPGDWCDRIRKEQDASKIDSFLLELYGLPEGLLARRS